MPAGPTFPAFLKLEYRDDGSAKGSFLSAVDNTLGAAEKRFAQFSTEASRQLGAALSTPRTAGGSLNLDVAGQQAAANAAKARAVAARELASATAIAAKENGDFSQSTRLAVAALQAQAREEEQAAAAALSHARALEQVQGVLNRQASAVTTLSAATRRNIAVNDNATVSAGQHRAALNQLNFQVGDIAQGLALGVAPAVIFAQQAGQVGQAVSLMGGSARGVGAFLGGPWGIALTTATVVLAPFIGKLFEAKSAADSVSFSSYQLGDAQALLGNTIDITTGKVRSQSAALVALARAQALAGQIKARSDLAEARSQLGSLATIRPHIGAGFGGGLTITRGRDAAGDIASALLDGSLNPSEAVAGLASLQRAGVATEKSFLEAAKAVTQFGVAAENLKAFQSVERLITGQGTAADRALLLKPNKPHKPRKAKSGDGGAAARQEFGEDARDRIATISEQFSKIPSAVQSAIKTTRQLDDIIDDLARKKPVNFEATIADARAAKAAIADGIVRPFQEAQRNADRQYEVHRLTLAGRNAEAAALESIFALEEKLGSEETLRAKAAELVTKGRTAEAAVIEQILAAYPELKQQARDLAELEEQRSRALDRAREIQNAYLDATRNVRSEVEAILSGTGRLGNFQQIFRQLQGKILTEQIFGPIFSKIEKAVLKETGIDAAVEKLAADTTRAGNSALAFADTLDEATRRISGAVPGEATLGNASAAGAGLGFLAAIVGGASAAGTAGNTVQGGLQPNGDILVPRDRPSKDTVAGMTPGSYADLVANELTRPLLKGLDGLIPGLSGVFGGALSGYVTGGVPGGIIGALKNVGGLSKGIDGLPNAFGKVLGKAGEGAAAGTAIAGLAKAFGFKKFSTTGSQIGGAIGSALPIPGGQIIGSIIGGTIGGLLKKTKTGSATLSIGSDGVQVGSTGGNSGSRTKAASAAGDGIGDALNRIAEQLGGTASGAIGVSIGVRNKSFRVDTTGAGRTKGAGVLDFGQDQAAAVTAAIADAIKDGVIQGISAGAQRLIQGGKDLDRQLQKALDFEGTLARAKALRDPVGAALDTLDKEFTRLRSIFTEAGASAAEYADLEKLYGAERAQAVKQATESLTGSLRGLLNDLTIGNDALSLRDRKSAALAKYDPLEARVKAGDTSAFDDYATAARSLLDIERQFSGSQGGYFALLDQVKATTQGRLDGFDALAASSIGRDSPFSSNPLPADNTSIVDAVDRQTSELLAGLGAQLSAVNSNLGALIGLSKPAQTPLYLPQAVGHF